jgi:threonylcarbamoyladenosine tRNA methylthiotransferase MtaB
MTPTVAFRTLGCKLNQAETAILRGQFAEKSYRIVPWGERADVTVVNTCTVTARSDSKCRQAVSHALKVNPETTVIVVGCYSQVSAESVRRLPGVDFVFGTRDKFSLFDHFPGPGKRPSPLVSVSPVRSETGEPRFLAGAFGEQTRAFLEIQNGCSRSCAYCIVPLARGPGRSLEPGRILEQARILVGKGYREIVLTGTHIGDFGKESGGRSRLPELIGSLCGLAGMGRIRLSSLDPEDLDETLIESVRSNPNVCRHFHLSLQSGSDAVLKAMNRNSPAGAVRRKVERLASTLGPAGLGADVITGFPGETDALFEETRSFLTSLPFTYLHVFPFSVRAGTAAETLPEQVSPKVRMLRAEALRRLGQEKKKRFLGLWVGRTVQALMEGRNRDGRMGGLTSEYVRVEVPFDRALSNRLVQVRIEEAGEMGVRGRVV